MPNKGYRRGAAFERLIVKKLEAAGYYAVRSAGSHGVADVVAMKLCLDRLTFSPFVQILLVQAKAGNKSLSLREWNDLYDQATEFPGGIPLVAHRPTGRGLAFREITGKAKPYGKRPACHWELSDGEQTTQAREK